MAAVNRRRLLEILLWRRRMHARSNLLYFLYISQKKKQRAKKRFWVRSIYKKRKEKGEYSSLVLESRLVDHEIFYQMFRMSPCKFDELLSIVGPKIQRDCLRREPISPEERLYVTLRYLTTGDSFSTISNSYRMSPTTVGRIVQDTCKHIWLELCRTGYLNVPSTNNEWKQVADEFDQRWNFPHCIGAIDGKHVIIQCPKRGGSMYFNYKKFHSIVLMAVVDANYQFIMVDVGDYGRLSDGSVFASSNLGSAINNDILNVPRPCNLGNSQIKFPFVFVADDAFPLKPCLMKPFPGQNLTVEERIFNYRLSRARRIVENAFGIATSRFRVFRRPICASVETVNQVTKAVVALHNFLMKSKSEKKHYCPPDLVDQEVNGVIQEGTWREKTLNAALEKITHTGSNNYSVVAKEVRKNFKTHFNSPEGLVSWQWKTVHSTTTYFDECLVSE